jgi:aminotransferase EvaB
MGGVAAFSFYPTKNLAAMGDGGMHVLGRQAEPSLLAKARRMCLYGWDQQRQAVQFGINSRLDEMQTWILSRKLSDLNERIQVRRRNANHYCELPGSWASRQGIHLPKDGVNRSHSHHLFVITVDPAKRPEAPQHQLPRAEHLRQGLVVSLPLNPYLKEEDVVLTSAHLHSILDKP